MISPFFVQDLLDVLGFWQLLANMYEYLLVHVQVPHTVRSGFGDWCHGLVSQALVTAWACSQYIGQWMCILLIWACTIQLKDMSCWVFVLLITYTIRIQNHVQFTSRCLYFCRVRYTWLYVCVRVHLTTCTGMWCVTVNAIWKNVIFLFFFRISRKIAKELERFVNNDG